MDDSHQGSFVNSTRKYWLCYSIAGLGEFAGASEEAQLHDL